MPEPFSTAGVVSAKLLNVAAGFLGALIALGLTSRRFPVRQIVALIAFGAVGAYFIPPAAVAAMQDSQWPKWAQSEGLIAWLLGLGCIFITRAMNAVGERFAKDPVEFVLNRGRKSDPAEKERRHDS